MLNALRRVTDYMNLSQRKVNHFLAMSISMGVPLQKFKQSYKQYS